MTELILLVEDNPRDVEITLDAIAEGRPAAIVAVVHNGEEALDYLHRRGDHRLRAPGHPNVILLDIKMPKVSGFELLARLRADQAFAQVAVVILSSSGEEQDLFRAYEHQADGYLIRPPRPQPLTSRLTSPSGRGGSRLECGGKAAALVRGSDAAAPRSLAAARHALGRFPDCCILLVACPRSARSRPR